MNILWLTKLLPYPAQSGDLIYSRHLLEGCVALGAQIHVICSSSEGDPPDIPGLTWSVGRSPLLGPWRALFSTLPHITARFGNFERRSTVTNALRGSWDGVVFDHIGSLAVFDEVRDAVKRMSPMPFIVYVSHNHEETTRKSAARDTKQPLVKLAQYVDALKTAVLERRTVSHCDLLSVITNEDLAQFRRHNPQVRHILVNPGYDGGRSPKRALGNTCRTAVVLGSYQWIAKRLNLEALLEAAAPILPAAGVELRVVGYMDDGYRQSLIRRFPWASIVGPVAHVSDELSRARIGVVAEQAGGGFKCKILDYVFSRVAIASLDLAMAGVPLAPGEHYLSAHGMSSLVETIAANIDNTDMLEAIADAAYARCETQFNWKDRCRKLLDAFKGLARERKTFSPGDLHDPALLDDTQLDDILECTNNANDV